MAQSINEVMTHDPRTVEASATLVEAARAMKEADAGAIIVTEDDGVAGIITDRDIVVRAVAAGQDPTSATVGDICSRDVTSLTPESSVDEAIQIVRNEAVRRIPVVQDGRPVGIVSIADLALERDEDSALAEIAAAPSNN